MIRIVDATGHIKSFAEIERLILVEAIDYYRGRPIAVLARHLNIGRSTIYRKCHEHNINLKDFVDGLRGSETHSAPDPTGDLPDGGPALDVSGCPQYNGTH